VDVVTRRAFRRFAFPIGHSPALLKIWRKISRVWMAMPEMPALWQNQKDQLRQKYGLARLPELN
jgi:agmatine/peptidylarginine deiminase